MEESINTNITAYQQLNPYSKYVLLLTIRFTLNLTPIDYISDVKQMNMTELLRMEGEISGYFINQNKLMTMIMKEKEEEREKFVREELEKLEKNLIKIKNNFI